MAADHHRFHRHDLLCTGNDQVIGPGKKTGLLFQLLVFLRINTLVWRHRDKFHQHLCSRQAADRRRHGKRFILLPVCIYPRINTAATIANSATASIRYLSFLALIYPGCPFSSFMIYSPLLSDLICTFHQTCKQRIRKDLAANPCRLHRVPVHGYRFSFCRVF